MKQLGVFVMSFLLMFFALNAFAQEAPVIGTEEFLMFLIQSLGGIKGAGTLAIVAIVVQILLKFLGSSLFNFFFKNIDGAVKLMVVTGLTLILGVVGLMSQGLSFIAAATHSATLSAGMVFAHQLYKHFFPKKEE